MQNKPVHIVYICGSAKEGADGIGDYTRRLACYLLKLGHQASILAFSDAFVNAPQIEMQNSGGVSVEVLRLPRHLKDKEKFKSLKEYVERKNPDWISLQYVLYAFHDKGLPFSFASQLKKAVGKRRFEIMFHELWLGMEKRPILKDRIYGYFQSRIIKNMMQELQPEVVHTHSRAYKILLQYHGISALHLPIFSNIPIAHELQIETDLNKKEELSFLLFGHISPGAPIKEFAEELSGWIKSSGKSASITFAGRNGGAIDEWEMALSANKIPYTRKGVLETSELSDLMASSDIGIATTPVLLYEKSGSVAAMLKHGLPVLNIAAEWEPETSVSFAYAESITEYNPGILSAWLTTLKKNQPLKNLGIVSEQFVRDLNKCE